MRRPLLIALVGLILISLLDWSVDYQIGQYQQQGQAEYNNSALFGGAVALRLCDWLAPAWGWIDRNNPPLTVIFAAAVFVVTIGIVVYTKALWASTSKLVDASEDAAKKELRAYLGIQEAVIGLIPFTHYQLRLTIQNYGRTPARHVRVYFAHRVENSGYAGPFEERPMSGPFPLPPNGQRLMRKVLRDVPLGDTDTDRIARDREIFVWGQVEYFDIYDRRQTVDFRFHTREIISSGGWALQPTKEGNDAT